MSAPLLEPYTKSGHHNCPCGALWLPGPDGAWRMSDAGAVVAKSETDAYICDICGHGFRILKAGQPVPAHPRER